MITRETDYSMRLILALAMRHKANIPTMSSAEVAKEMDIPYRFLRKLVVRLVSSGLINSRRGKGGGISLAKAASAISLADILRATGPRGAELTPCMSEPATCRRSGLCRIHEEFKIIQKEVDKRLQKVRISDLV